MALSHSAAAAASIRAGRVGVYLVPEGHYCARVNTVQAYGDVNREVSGLARERQEPRVLLLAAVLRLHNQQAAEVDWWACCCQCCLGCGCGVVYSQLLLLPGQARNASTMLYIYCNCYMGISISLPLLVCIPLSNSF
jgi:hypothetical protein